MDILAGFQRKSRDLSQDSLLPLAKKLQSAIHNSLIQHTAGRPWPEGLVRAASFELSYLLLRHRAWHYASLLAELATDFLVSEYQIPGGISELVVEAGLEVIHGYTAREAHWSAADYEREFLEHLIVCSLLSLDEESLAGDLGFGANVMRLLRSALALEDQGDSVHFPQEVALQINEIMRSLFDELERFPEAMDMYRLKNHLQRDEATPKYRLTAPYLRALNSILAACWPEGRSEADLMAEHPTEHFASDLRLLMRSGLIYAEPQAKRSKGPRYRLSAKGYEFTCMQFGFTRWRELGQSIHLQDLPAAYQATALQLLAKENGDKLQALLAEEGPYLRPVALRFVVDHLKQANDAKSLLEIFENLLHNKAHAWIRVEICQALPLPNGEMIEDSLLQTLLHEDPSPMVRSAARAAVQRQRLRAGPSQEDRNVEGA